MLKHKTIGQQIFIRDSYEKESEEQYIKVILDLLIEVGYTNITIVSSVEVE